MKYASRSLGIAIWLLSSTSLLAQNGPSSTGNQSAPPGANSNETQLVPSTPPTTQGPVDILTDTRGVDLGPYVTRIVNVVRPHWYAVIPPSARAPLMKKGTLLIQFRVTKDGNVTDLQYVQSSGDVALDQAAHDGITSSAPFPPLPKDFACEYVALRFHFYYNPAKGDLKQNLADRPYYPCVTSSLHVIGEVGIKVLPNSAELLTGAKQQFSAILRGTENSAVNWSVKGSGCAASACGSISVDVLYTAPSNAPDPPKITVTVAPASNPSETDSATITIVQPNPPH